MKSTTRTFGIIWGVLSLIVFLILIILSTTLSAGKDAAIQTLVDGGMSVEEATESVGSTIATVFTFSFLTLAAAVYALLLAILVGNPKIKKIPGIVIGAVGIALGALIPGILFVIYYARPNKEEPEEVSEEN